MIRVTLSVKHARALLDSEGMAYDEAVKALRTALAPKPKSSAKKRTEAGRRAKREQASEIRAALVVRAGRFCESCSVGHDHLELDHFRGRGKVAQSVENCWLLCWLCHRQKTHNTPDAATWLERFAAHCDRHGYTVEATLARNRLAFVTARKGGAR